MNSITDNEEKHKSETGEFVITGLSRAFDNKDINAGYTRAAYSHSFVATTVTAWQLFQHLTSGKAFSVAAFKDNHRKEDNFLSSQIIALDFDQDVSIADCLQHEFIATYASFIYPSASSGQDGIHKTRPVFILDRAVDNVAKYRRLVLAVQYACQELDYDPSCKDAARFFYGSNNTYEQPVYRGAILPVALLDTIAAEMDSQQDSHEQTTDRSDDMNRLIRTRNSEHLKDDKQKYKLYRYARVSLDNMANDLSSLSEGNGRYGGRNNTAFIYGARAGHFIAAGMIDRSEGMDILLNAAISSGLPRYEAYSAVRNGMQEGEQTPFDIASLQQNPLPYRQQGSRYGASFVHIDPPQPPLYETEALPGGYSNLSWTKTKHLPLEMIRALLTLSDTRSILTLVMLKLHAAFRSGKLDTHSFTLPQVLSVLNTPRLSTTKAFKTLIEWGFVLDSELYYSIESKANYPIQKSCMPENGGRPARHYQIETNTNWLMIHLTQKLELYVLERHTSKALAPRLHTLLHEVDILDKRIGTAWQQRIEKLLSPLVKARINADLDFWYERLLHGQYQQQTVAYDLDNLDNRSLRALLLQEHIAQFKDGIPMNQHELERLLGLKSSSSLNDIYELANIKAIEQKEWVTVHNPNVFRTKEAITGALYDAAKPQHNRRGGVALAINFKTYGGKWLKRLAYVGVKGQYGAYAQWLENVGIIDDLKVMVQLPSLIRFKTALELEQEAAAKKAQERQLNDATQDKETAPESGAADEQGINPDEMPKTPEKGNLNRNRKMKKETYTTRPDRKWDKHDPQWLWQQLQCEVFCWLNMDLREDGKIFDATGTYKLTLKDAKQLVIWIGQEIARREISEPYHYPDSYYGTVELDFSDVEPTF